MSHKYTEISASLPGHSAEHVAKRTKAHFEHELDQLKARLRNPDVTNPLNLADMHARLHEGNDIIQKIYTLHKVVAMTTYLSSSMQSGFSLQVTATIQDQRPASCWFLLWRRARQWVCGHTIDRTYEYSEDARFKETALSQLVQHPPQPTPRLVDNLARVV